MFDRLLAIKAKEFGFTLEELKDTQGSKNIKDELWDYEDQPQRWEDIIGGSDLESDGDDSDAEFTEREMEPEAAEKSLLSEKQIKKHEKIAAKQAAGVTKVAEKAAKAAAKATEEQPSVSPLGTPPIACAAHAVCDRLLAPGYRPLLPRRRAPLLLRGPRTRRACLATISAPI